MALEYTGPIGTQRLQERIANPILLTHSKKGVIPPPLDILRGVGTNHVSELREAFIGLITQPDYVEAIRTRADRKADTLLTDWIRYYLQHNELLGIARDGGNFIKYDNPVPTITTSVKLGGLCFEFDTESGHLSFRVEIKANLNVNTSSGTVMPNQAQGLMCLLLIELFHSWPKRRRTHLTNNGTWPCDSFQEVTQKASNLETINVEAPFALIEALEALEPYKLEIIDNNKIVVQLVKHDIITTVYPTECSELTADGSAGRQLWKHTQHYETGAPFSVDLDGSARAQHVVYSRTMLLHVLSMFYLGELADGTATIFKLNALQKDLLKKIEGYTSTDPYRV